MKEYKLTIVGCEEGDWYGVYVDDDLYDQGHRLDAWLFGEIISKYQHFHSVIGNETLSNEQMDELGCTLPQKLKHVFEVVER